MSSKPAHRRSRMFVDSSLQGSLIRRLLMHWVTFVAVGTVIACALRWMTHPTVPLSSQAGEMFAQFGPFLITMLAMLPIFVLDTIKLTNRFAGPFVRFRQNLVSLRGGQSDRVTFRGGDFWHDTEDDLNAIIDELASLRKEVVELRGNVVQTSSSGGPADADISELAATSPELDVMTPTADGGAA